MWLVATILGSAALEQDRILFLPIGRRTQGMDGGPGFL